MSGSLSLINQQGIDYNRVAASIIALNRRHTYAGTTTAADLLQAIVLAAAETATV